MSPQIGAMAEDMADHLKPIIKRCDPDIVVLSCGTNNVGKGDNLEKNNQNTRIFNFETARNGQNSRAEYVGTED